MFSPVLRSPLLKLSHSCNPSYMHLKILRKFYPRMSPFGFSKRIRKLSKCHAWHGQAKNCSYRPHFYVCGQSLSLESSTLTTGYTLRWRHNGRDSVSNHQPLDCLLNRLFRRRSKKTSKLRVTGLCAGNLPGTGEFPAQMASNAENISIWWRHHVY